MNEHAPIDHAKLAESMPLEDINVSDPKLYQQDVWMHYFDRLRREAPVHYCKDSPIGPFWSISKYKDIVSVEVNHKAFSSSSTFGGITLRDRTGDLELPMFIAMDQPKHDEQRKIVQPIVSPANLAKFEGLIRSRIQNTLDSLPRGEAFDWVDKVSIELTGQMLATLFDFPFEQRRKLTYWSDVATTDLNNPDRLINSEEEREQVFGECLGAFMQLWNQRVNAKELGGDLISMLVSGEATRNMNPREYLGNVILLIVGGNDTTRNSMTGSVWFFNQNPDQYAKLRANPALLESAVPEIIRYQTPLAYMRRTALADTEVGGKMIKKGDKLAMWYISGNRDGDAIENPDQFIIDRERPRQHLSFGFGIHRCVGNRLGELQLKILWEEILKRDMKIEVLAPPKRVYSSFVHGYQEMMVKIAP
ncbi:MAG: cytochrome P450 [Hyphomicrobiales bacterium]|nr:cytochrome P450 [Rhodoblastus sp.]MCB9998332.1 cytochrome P450 [Methylobacteriaceae bacterium]MCC2102618.1 cytochrome P450 [Hyphomicrobiales bacterium]MCC2107565.1 cytochrome P450 [Hyphomicrobiales bacterium]HPG02206.1 cytochrome P450 [Rhodoblastus sp.]